MVWYLVIGLLLWGALWYTFFYVKYSDAGQIDNLRKRHKLTQDAYEVAQHDLEELQAQNDLLKKKTISLLQQNEDYSKLISELSRYYFHIKEATNKVEELGKLLRVYDSDIDQKLTKVWVNTDGLLRATWSIPIHHHWDTSSWSQDSAAPKYF